MDRLRALIGLTLRHPSQAARVLLGLNLSGAVIMMALGATVAVNAIVSFLSLALVPPPPEMRELIEMISPIGFALFIAVTLLVMAGALTLSGRALGGRARFLDMVLSLVWIQGVMLVFEAALILVMLVLPALAALAVLPLYALTLIWTVIFLQVAHGMEHPGRAFIALILGLLGLGFTLQILLF